MNHSPKVLTLADGARTRKSAAAERLKAARIKRGLTQEQAAQRNGLDPRQVRRWENGEVPLGPLELLCDLEAA
jgi:transcriptional regulator with XRE-family HTH domain